MKTVELPNWEAFDAEMERLSQEYSVKNKGWVSQMLFRGQSDSSWKLETTLERYPVQLLKAGHYYTVILSAKPQIETYTNRSWTIPEPQVAMALLNSKEGRFGLIDFPAYEYMVYLRHHGFPSPLLDWTQSPYVAAFFAFHYVDPKATSVSVYAFLEYLEKGKLSSPDSPAIHTRGAYITSHRRHFLQQCEYSVCVVRKAEGWYYACHEDVFAQGEEEQDLLWKFNLPISERTKVLQALDRYNLNAYSLFGSEESLMETMANREILFREAVWIDPSRHEKDRK